MRSISVSQCQHIKMSGNSCVRPQPPGEVCVSVAGSGEYDQPDVMLYGVQKVKDSSVSSLHPLEYSLKHWTENAAMRDLDMLKITQGLHAPLKLQMERKVTSRPLRLPCLPGSNVMYETLTGDDESIGFVDLFNTVVAFYVGILRTFHGMFDERFSRVKYLTFGYNRITDSLNVGETSDSPETHVNKQTHSGERDDEDCEQNMNVHLAMEKQGHIM